MTLKNLLALSLIIPGIASISAQENIAGARAMATGSAVTVSGIVTSGPELGTIRFMQDRTAGIAVYSSAMDSVNRGDSVTVSGVLKEFSTLLEIDPVEPVTVHSTDHTLPDPVVLTPGQLAEQYEGMLVRINEAEFIASGNFERTAYTFMAGGEEGQVYINSFDSPLIGTPIPTGAVNLTGPLGAYSNIFQVLPRDAGDLKPSSSIHFTGAPVVSKLDTAGFTVSWNTDTAGTTEAIYGFTPGLELGNITVPGTSAAHAIDLSGLEPAQLVYFQPYSVSGSDTATSAVQVYITRSVSSGTIRTYFNRTVDPSVSLGILEAQQLDRSLDDTLIAYIDRAEESVDVSIYNLNNSGISSITGALNAAHQRGITVRVVYDGERDPSGVSSLDAGIGRIASPDPLFPVYGFMHNKFVVIDADAGDPDKPLVWTGSTNFTDNQVNLDPNNVVVIQDQSLARAFQLEFNEMFGSDGALPDPESARFGPDKRDNTPHEFIIGGKRVECYFSPSDNTHARIRSTIETAGHSIYIASMLINMADIGEDLVLKNNGGADVKVLIDGYDQTGEPIVNNLKSSLQEDIRVAGEAGIMHHKYMIIDQGNADSDPILLTGSHNWSASAQLRNDENTLVIHDQGVANAYYQEFVARFAMGELLVAVPECVDDHATMTEGTFILVDVLENDALPGPVNLVITRAPDHGSAQVEPDRTITYVPDSSFYSGNDTIGYLVCLESNPVLCDSALLIVQVDRSTGLADRKPGEDVRVYPNPAGDHFFISSENGHSITGIMLMDQSGRILMTRSVNGLTAAGIQREGIAPGIYYVRITLGEGAVITRKIAFR